MVANGNVANLVTQNHVQNRHRAQRIRRSHLAQLGLHGRRRVQPARLQRARHQRHAGQHVALGFFCHVPQAGVGREVTIVITHALQVGAQQAEVLRFFCCNAEPVGVVVLRHAVKSPDRIECQIDGVEFDMRHRV